MVLLWTAHGFVTMFDFAYTAAPQLWDVANLVSAQLMDSEEYNVAYILADATVAKTEPGLLAR